MTLILKIQRPDKIKKAAFTAVFLIEYIYVTKKGHPELLYGLDFLRSIEIK